MISKVYSRNKHLWSISCHSLIMPPRVFFKMLLNSSLWICSFFTVGLEGSHYFSNKLSPNSTGVNSVGETPTIFDPLKPAPLHLGAPVSSCSPVPSFLLIHTCSQLFKSADKSHLGPAQKMVSKEPVQGYEGSAQGMVAFPLFLFSLSS